MSPAAGADSNSIANTSIQGTPLSVSEAQSSRQCLTTGTDCPAVSGSPSVRGILTEFAIVGVVVAVLAVIAIVLVTERRRVPPTVYPNANLYPPGTARGPTRGTVRSSSGLASACLRRRTTRSTISGESTPESPQETRGRTGLVADATTEGGPGPTSGRPTG